MLDASGNPERPTLFLKGPNCVNAPDGTVHAPDFVGRLDYEGEMGIVMKKRAKDVREEDALEYILGITCLNDVTARDIQKSDGQWARGKSMDGFAPIGPVITDEVDPPDRQGSAEEQYGVAHYQCRENDCLYYRLYDAGAGGCDCNRHPGWRWRNACRRCSGSGNQRCRDPAQPNCLIPERERPPDIRAAAFDCNSGIPAL